MLFEPGTPCAGFPLVLEGSVHVAMRAPSGREILPNRVAPGESCILSGGCLLSHSDYSPAVVPDFPYHASIHIHSEEKGIRLRISLGLPRMQDLQTEIAASGPSVAE